MAPRGASTAVNPIRLQTVKKLKIKRPDKAQEVNPCVGAMTAVLSKSSPRHAPQDQTTARFPNADSKQTGCWASSGYTVGGCAVVEQTLRECMDAPVSPYHQFKSSVEELTLMDHDTESTSDLEKSHQLPPYKIISKHCRTKEEKRKSGLNSESCCLTMYILIV